MCFVWRLSQSVLLLTGFLLFCLTSQLQARPTQPPEGMPPHVLSFEPVIPVTVNAQLHEQPACRDCGAGRPAGSEKKQETSFYAFGRQFDLLLEPNELFAPDAENIWVGDHGETREAPTTIFYKGVIKGEPDSWARVSMQDGVLDGMLHTKDETYFIEPGARFFASASPYEMVIYRLSDTVSDWEPGSCALEYPAAQAEMERHTDSHLFTGDYETLVSDLRALASNSELKQLDLGIVADYGYFQKHGASSATDMQNIINQIDGIFRAELGVTLRVTKTVVYTTPNEPFSSTTDPVALLIEFGQYKGDPANPVYDTGVAHLFTNRDLNGNTIGIAWMGTVCNPSYGAGLSQDYTTNNKSLVILTAHEIGHNFDAPHDNQNGSACASAPFGYIMNPYISTQLNLEFSACSKDFIAAKVAAARCLTPVSDEPPSTPTPIAPTGSITNTTPTFQWSESAEATHYTLTVHDNTAGVDIILTNVATTTYTSPIPLNRARTYKWKVRAVNAAGASADSSWMNFDYGTTSVIPPPPTPVSPQGSITNTKPTFRWNPVPGARHYKLVVFNNTTQTYVVTKTISTSTFTLRKPLNPTHTYKWRVRALNAAGSGAYSPWTNFDYRVAQQLPATPTPVGPQGQITDPTPTFQWEAVPGATQYRLVVYDLTARTYVLSQRPSSTTFTSTHPLDPTHTYRWRVRALNAAGASTYSRWRTFMYP